MIERRAWAFVLALFAAPASAETFRDCPACPLMIELPGGVFVMGASHDEPGGRAQERPQHRVSVPAFAIGVCETTQQEWAACVADGFCQKISLPDGWDGARRPMSRVPRRLVGGDETGFLGWLNAEMRRQGRPERYRLPSEAEWEYAARGGTQTPYWTGETLAPDAEFFGQDHAKPREVGLGRPNPFGLHDMHGDVAEMVADCWHEGYDGAPSDGSAWGAEANGMCDLVTLRGGAWHSPPENARSAFRTLDAAESGFSDVGFRVVRTLAQ